MHSNGHKGPPTNGNGPQGADNPQPAPAAVLNLRQKLAQIRREVGYIQKRGRNEAQNYSYAMAADIAGVIGDRLAALNVILGRSNLERQARRKPVRTRAALKPSWRSRSIMSSSTATATRF